MEKEAKTRRRKIHVDLPEQMHQKLRVKAALEDVSMQAFVTRIVDEAVKDVVRAEVLQQEEAAMSFGPRFTITNAIAAELTRIERARGFLDAAKLSEDWIAGMQKRALVLEAHHTTHIEGTHLTLEQSERILADYKVREARPDDAKELLNYSKAFELVSG